MASRRHGTGRGATRSAELAARDAAIRQGRTDAASVDELAARHGINCRQVQRIVSGPRTPPRRAPTVGGLAAVAADPVAELEGMLRSHTDVLVELEELCRATGHDGVRLGAPRARADHATQRLAIFRNVPVLRNEHLARDLLDRFLLVIGQHAERLPDEFVADLGTVVETFEPTQSPLKEAA